MDKEALRIGGLTPLTSLDYPGGTGGGDLLPGLPLALLLLSQPAPAAARWRPCHPLGPGEAFLERRQGLLDAVVFSGGEPTLQNALPAALSAGQGMGFKIGLHTAGIYPERLGVLGPLLDWVGLDIKALPEDYPAVTGAAGAGERAWRSLRLLVATGVPLEVRTTLPPDWRLARGMETLMRRLADAGVQDYALQTQRDTHPRHEDPRKTGFPAPPPPETYAKLGEALFRRFVLR